MATDYGNTIFEGELSPSVSLVNPVDDKSGQYLADGIKSTVDSVSSLLFSNNGKAAKAEAAKNSLFGEIAERINMYADAREQGVSNDEIMRRLRVDSNAWAANNPGMVEDIYTFQNKMLADNGLAGNINRETPQETGARKKIESATADGWDVSTPQGMATYDRFQLQTNQLKQLEQEISLAGSQGRMVTAQMQNEATLTLHGIVQTGTTWVNTQLDRANKLLSQTNDPQQRQAIIQQTKAQVAQQTGFIGAQRTASGNSIDTSYLTAGIDSIMKVWEETADGTADLTALQNAQKATETSNLLLVYQTNPKLAQLVAMNKAAPFEMPDMIRKMDQEMMNTYSKLFDSSSPVANPDGSNSSPNKPPDLVEKVENIGLVTSALKESTKTALNDKNATPEQIDAQGNKLFNAIRSINAYGGTDTDAKNFMSVVDLFADTSVGKFLEANPNLIDMSASNQAKQIIQQNYEGTVLPLVNENWQTAMIEVSKYQFDAGDVLGLAPQTEEIDATKSIKPVWNGVGIEFVVDDKFVTNPAMLSAAKKLNNEVAPAVNRMVRSHAHLSGTTDYEKIYNEQYASRLWITGDETPDNKTDAGDTLNTLTNVPDYSGPAPTRPDGLTITPSSVKGRAGELLNAIGNAEGADYSTLFGYAEKPGAAFAGTDVTNMTIDEVQKLQKQMVASNGISSAVGKYQFLQTTLREAAKALGISGKEKFTPEVQDKLALWLLQNRTDYQNWLSGVGDDDTFQDQLAKIWASVPNTKGKSAYANDGVNKATSGGRALIGIL